MASDLSRLLLLCVFSGNLIRVCIAYKLLVVFSLPVKSHQHLSEGYVRLLSQAGHEITYISSFPMKNIPLGVRQILLQENKAVVDIDFIRVLQANQALDLVTIADIIYPNYLYFNLTFHNEEVQKLIQDSNVEFDAVIVEWTYTEIYAGLAVVFNCPFIWSSSLEPHSMLLSLVDEYLNPAYTVHHISRDYGFSFWQRAQQLWVMTQVRLLKWSLEDYEEREYIKMFQSAVEKRGRTLPAYEDIKYNSSLILGNSYISTGEAINLPANYKYIGGYHIPKEIDPLPKELQKVMDEAKYGVIYFSLGSMLYSSLLPKDFTREILQVFGALNQTVIWKFEEALTDIPKNVHVMSWAPQLSVLAHPNCVLFISHGGILSKHEALHFGVPMIGMPHYLDQFMNVNIGQSKGFMKKVDIYSGGSRELDLAIREVLRNSSYRERAREYSFIHHHRPVSPQQELVHWVEHVIKTRGALHLRSPALHVPWYQKYYVDLAAGILLLIVVLSRLCKQVLKILKRCLKKKRA